MGEKSWRITDEQEFLQKASKYLENHLEEFIETIDLTIRDKSKVRSIWKKFNTYRKNSINSVYVNNLKLKINDLLDICLEDVNNWTKFSMDINSPLDEIMLRLLINTKFNCDYVSNLFISVNPNLTEDFVEDCIYVSSDLFKFEEWDDVHVEAVSSAAAQCIPEDLCDSLLELYDKKRLSSKTIPIRLNLKEFCCINKDPLFTTKYYSYLNQTDLEKKYQRGRIKY